MLTGISRYSRKNKLSDAHNLLTLRICSVYKKNGERLIQYQIAGTSAWWNKRFEWAKRKEIRVQRMRLTVTPYLRAIPWRVSVAHTVCFTKLSVLVMCLAVLPYFFRAFPVSRIYRRSSISLPPFRSILYRPLSGGDIRKKTECITIRRHLGISEIVEIRVIPHCAWPHITWPRGFLRDLN